MSTIRFALSALFPGNSPSNQWDQNWTPNATQYQWTANGGPPTTLAGGSVSLAGGIAATDSFNSFAFGGTHLTSATPLVTVNTYAAGDGSHQDVTLNAVWNTIKDIQLTNLDTAATTVTGFVDTWIEAGADNADHAIEVDGAKRGKITLGDGNDSVRVNFASNESSWSNIFLITTGNGNDTIAVTPESFDAIAAMPTPVGWVFNRTPQTTTALIATGDGNDHVDLEASGTVRVGNGTDLIKLVDGVHVVQLGGGDDTVAISAHDLQQPATAAFSTQRDVNSIYFGAGHATIAIDDAQGPLTPLTVLHIAHGNTGGGTEATADVLRYGHADAVSGDFVGGNWSAMNIILTGYGAGSTATLAASASGAYTDLLIADTATGSTDMLLLDGAAPPGVAALHVRFQ